MKLMWMSDSPFLNTGFSSQSLFLLNGLADKGWDCYYQVAQGHAGQYIPKNNIKLEDGTPFNFGLYGCGKMNYSVDILPQRIQKLKPNVFGILLDTFMMYPTYLQLDLAPAHLAWWYPSDGGGGLPTNCEQILKKVHLPVAMSRFGKKQVKDYYGLNTEYIPHGVDTKMFHPLSQEEKEALKRKWNVKDKFVIGVVSRNQGRKTMDRLIKTLALFKEVAHEAQDAILLLHTDPNDNAAVFSLVGLVNRLGLQNRVRFTGMTWLEGFTYEQMNEVYNLMDVFFLSTSGEGFGVPIVEAQSCGIPCVVTDYTSTHELLVEDGESGLPVNLVGTESIDKTLNQQQQDYLAMNGTMSGSWNVERATMDIHDAKQKLMKLYNEHTLREKLGKTGREKAINIYDWKHVIDAWDSKLKKLIGEGT